MTRRCGLHVSFLAVCVAVAGSLTAAAAVTPQQREALSTAVKEMNIAARLYVAGKYEESAEHVLAAERQMVELAAAENANELERELAPLQKQIARARELLTGKGVKLADPPPPSTPAAGLSFTRDVAPMLVSKCGNCHIRDSKGGFNTGTFAALMKGSEGGVVIFPGNAEGSRLIEVIESGDMPRGGGKLTAQEFKALVDWINAGAKFDGPNPNAPLAAAGTPPPTPAPSQPLAVQKPTGKETVSFSGELSRVFSAQCVGCHSGQRPAGQLNLDSFAGLLKGGNGPAIVPGNPDESLLVRKLRGQAGQRMPLRRPPLSDAVIAKFATWIAEGAKFDGPDPNMTMAGLIRNYASSRMSAEELAAQRLELATRNWQLAMPGTDLTQVETPGLVVCGDLSETRLREIGHRADEVQRKVARVLRLPEDQPLIKGRLTVFAFQRRFNHSEFGLMVERRELPKHLRAHWRYDALDAYACVTIPGLDEDPIDTLLAEVIAGAYLDSLGDMPRWFSVGVAKAISARLEPKAAWIKAWEDLVPTYLSGKANFLAGDALSEENQVLSYAFGKHVLATRQFPQLFKSLRTGVPFKKAWEETYRMETAAYAANWVAKGGRSR